MRPLPPCVIFPHDRNQMTASRTKKKLTIPGSFERNCNLQRSMESSRLLGPRNLENSWTSLIPPSLMLFPHKKIIKIRARKCVTVFVLKYWSWISFVQSEHVFMLHTWNKNAWGVILADAGRYSIKNWTTYVTCRACLMTRRLSDERRKKIYKKQGMKKETSTWQVTF